MTLHCCLRTLKYILQFSQQPSRKMERFLCRVPSHHLHLLPLYSLLSLLHTGTVKDCLGWGMITTEKVFPLDSDIASVAEVSLLSLLSPLHACSLPYPKPWGPNMLARVAGRQSTAAGPASYSLPLPRCLLSFTLQHLCPAHTSLSSAYASVLLGPTYHHYPQL